MSTTSTNFAFVLATTADTVNVVTQIANNFSSIDGILAIAHTGTGQLKGGLTLNQVTINTGDFTGTFRGGLNSTLICSTAKINTITATGGLLTLNSFTIGTYAYPTTIGSTNQVLTVQTGNAVWVSNPGGTGAAVALDNLASVAINTNLNTFTAGFVTLARVLATSGSLTGLTVFQATTGTFAGNVTITGTMTANVVNCTGGAITAGGITIGTWALPATIAATGVMRSLSNTATWYTPAMVAQTAFSFVGLAATQITAGAGAVAVSFSSELYDLGNNAVTGVFTAPASGVYEFAFGVGVNGTGIGTAQGTLEFGIIISTTRYTTCIFAGSAQNASTAFIGNIINTVASGAVVSVYATASGFVAGNPSISTTGASYFTGKRLFEF